jgi:hypothetical protein
MAGLPMWMFVSIKSNGGVYIYNTYNLSLLGLMRDAN